MRNITDLLCHCLNRHHRDSSELLHDIEEEEDQLQEQGSTWQGQRYIPVQVVKETFHFQEEDLGLEQELGL